MGVTVNQKKLVELFINLASISSPSFSEKKIFDFVEEYLKGKFVQVKRIAYQDEHSAEQSENMIIRIPATDASKKGLFFDAHADTVCPCDNVIPVVDGDTIRSSGGSVLGADDKIGVASMLMAIDIILDHNISHGELVFIISSAEEVGLVGAGYVPSKELEGLSYGIILDSEGPVGSINLKAAYHYVYDITLTGRASHAGLAPEKGINAIKVAADILRELPSGRISEDTVCNVGMISGGTGRNVVPEEVIIKGEIRSLAHEKCQPIIDQINIAVHRHKDKAVHVDLAMHMGTVGYSFEERSPIILFIAEGLKNIGITPIFEESCGGTNANVYMIKGIQSTVVSVGMEEIHSINEYVRIKDLVDITRLIVQLIKQS